MAVVDSHGQQGKPWTGFDLDGTLAKYDGWKGLSHIGEPVEKMVELIKRLHAENKAVKIMTARVAPRDDGDAATPVLARAYIARWCRDNLGFVPPITHEKDSLMETLYDDRVKAVEQNTGKVLNKEDAKMATTNPIVSKALNAARNIRNASEAKLTDAMREFRKEIEQDIKDWGENARFREFPASSSKAWATLEIIGDLADYKDEIRYTAADFAREHGVRSSYSRNGKTTSVSFHSLLNSQKPSATNSATDGVYEKAINDATGRVFKAGDKVRWEYVGGETDSGVVIADKGSYLEVKTDSGEIAHPAKILIAKNACAANAKFKSGDTVKHKTNGLTGIVEGWASEPGNVNVRSGGRVYMWDEDDLVLVKNARARNAADHSGTIIKVGDKISDPLDSEDRSYPVDFGFKVTKVFGDKVEVMDKWGNRYTVPSRSIEVYGNARTANARSRNAIGVGFASGRNAQLFVKDGKWYYYDNESGKDIGPFNSADDARKAAKDAGLTVINSLRSRNAVVQKALNGSSSPWGFFVGEEVVIKRDPEKKKHRIKAIVGGDIILEGVEPRFDASELDTANYAGPYRSTNAFVQKALNVHHARNDEQFHTYLVPVLRKGAKDYVTIERVADEETAKKLVGAPSFRIIGVTVDESRPVKKAKNACKNAAAPSAGLRRAYDDWQKAKAKFAKWWNPDRRLSERPPAGADEAQKAVAFSNLFLKEVGRRPPNGYGDMTLEQMLAK